MAAINIRCLDPSMRKIRHSKICLGMYNDRIRQHSQQYGSVLNLDTTSKLQLFKSHEQFNLQFFEWLQGYTVLCIIGVRFLKHRGQLRTVIYAMHNLHLPS